VLEGTFELIFGLCIECTECIFRTWRNIHDIYCLVGHVVVAGRIESIVRIAHYDGTWRKSKSRLRLSPRVSGRVKWIGAMANLFHFYKNHSIWRGGRRKKFIKSFFPKRFVPY
jgi:hypothetical protein